MQRNPRELAVKLARLQELLRAWQRGVVLLSGGVDSGLLLRVAHEVWGEGLAALTFHGPHTLPGERTAARDLARTLGITHLEQEFDPFQLPDFRQNTPRRCYACKTALYRLGWQIAAAQGGEVLLDGANHDDRDDYRPGHQAARELGVRSPLQEVGLHKAEIRALSRQLGLPGWNRPAESCLATRFLPHTHLTPDALARVAAVEGFLQQQGFAPVRLRVHGPLVRLEISPTQWPQLLAEAVRVPLEALLRRLGYLYVTLDMKGYQTGSMNPVLSTDENERRNRATFSLP